MTEEMLPTEWTLSTLRVRYAETDQMGVVYYANYLVWFEIGRTDLCLQHGFAYRDMEREDGLYIMVAEARCRYKAPARYDDEIVIRTRVTGMRKRVLIFGYEIYRQTHGRTHRRRRDGARDHGPRWPTAHAARQVPGIALGESRKQKLESRNPKLKTGKQRTTAVILSEAKSLCSPSNKATAEILRFAQNDTMWRDGRSISSF